MTTTFKIPRWTAFLTSSIFPSGKNWCILLKKVCLQFTGALSIPRQNPTLGGFISVQSLNSTLLKWKGAWLKFGSQDFFAGLKKTTGSGSSTVDGRNPAITSWCGSLSDYLQGVIHPRVVQDFFHQQYVSKILVAILEFWDALVSKLEPSTAENYSFCSYLNQEITLA